MTVVAELNERALSRLGRLVPTSFSGWNGCLRCTGGCNLPLWPECQHPGVVAGELNLHDPRKNDKVYICSLRTNRGVVTQRLQFVLATPLSNLTGRWFHYGRNLVPWSIYKRRFPNPVLQGWLIILKGFWEEVTLKQTKLFLICKGLHLCLLKVLMVS